MGRVPVNYQGLVREVLGNPVLAAASHYGQELSRLPQTRAVILLWCAVFVVIPILVVIVVAVWAVVAHLRKKK